MTNAGNISEALRRFVSEYGADAPELLERAYREWFGLVTNHSDFIEECRTNRALLDAWELVCMAGRDSAKALSLLARRRVFESYRRPPPNSL